MKTLSEKVLLYRIQLQHDTDAFAALYDAYITQMYRFVYFKVNNREEAEDLTAEVFLKAWNYLQEKKEVKSFSGLLYRIARNCIIDLYRSRAHRTEVLLEDRDDISDQGAWYRGVDIQMEHQQLIKAMKRLKQEYQEVITLRFVDELTIEEIAEITNKGRVSVRVTLHRALKKLKEIVAQQPEG